MLGSPCLISRESWVEWNQIVFELHLKNRSDCLKSIRMWCRLLSSLISQALVLQASVPIGCLHNRAQVLLAPRDGGLCSILLSSRSGSHGLSCGRQLQAWLQKWSVSSHKCMICNTVDFCLAFLFVISCNASFLLRIFGNFIETGWLL